MDYTQYLNAKPSIRLRIEIDNRSGILNLCSTYGCYDKTSSISIHEGEIAALICPHCKQNLNTKVLCDICNAPIVAFDLEKGGKVHICSRAGCKNHYVSFEDIYTTLTSFYHEYDYGASETDF